MQQKDTIEITLSNGDVIRCFTIERESSAEPLTEGALLISRDPDRYETGRTIATSADGTKHIVNDSAERSIKNLSVLQG